MTQSRWLRYTACGAAVMAAPAVAPAQTTWTWTGDVSTSYNNSGNWTPGSVPSNNNFLVIDDPSTNSTCIVDTSSAVAMQEFTLQGASPTKMRLHVRDQAFSVTTRFFEFYDYGMIRAEKNFTSGASQGGWTDMHGNIWVDILETTPATVVYFKQNAFVDADGVTTLTFDDDTNGVFKMDNLEVEAYGSDHKALVLDGVSSTLTIVESLTIESNSSNDYKGKLWLKNGTLLVLSGTSEHAVLYAIGGSTSARAAQLDIDDRLDADQTEFSGHVDLDVESGLTAYGGEVVLGAGRHTKTGDGVFKSGPRP